MFTGLENFDFESDEYNHEKEVILKSFETVLMST